MHAVGRDLSLTGATARVAHLFENIEHDAGIYLNINTKGYEKMASSLSELESRSKSATSV